MRNWVVFLGIFFLFASTAFSAAAPFYEEAQGQIRARLEGTDAGRREAADRGANDGRLAALSLGEKDGHRKGEAEGRLRDYAAGFRAGHVRGVSGGEEAGKRDGEQTGLREGEAHGFDIGLQQGYNLAYHEGFEVGHGKVATTQKPGTFQAGLTDGRAAGLLRARKVAMKEDYRRGREEASEAQRTREPRQHLTVNNGMTDADAGWAYTGPLHALQDWVMHRTSWLFWQPLHPGKHPEPNASGTEVGNGGPQRMESVIGGLRDFWAEWPGSATELTEAGHLPEPDFRFRLPGLVERGETRTALDSEAFETAYRSAFASDYPRAYRTAYEEAYPIALGKAREEAAVLTYPEETERADAEGYRVGYDAAYTLARRKAYLSGFPYGQDRGVQESITVRRSEGFADGVREGFNSGYLEVASAEYRRGYTQGDAKGFADSITGESAAAYQLGRTDEQADLAKSFRLWAVGATLSGEGSGSSLRIGAKTSVSVRLRNFGGAEAPHGKLSVQIEEVPGGALRLLSDDAVLRDMPADSEVLFENVILAFALNGGRGPGFRLTVKVLEEGKVIAAFPIEGKILVPENPPL